MSYFFVVFRFLNYDDTWFIYVEFNLYIDFGRIDLARKVGGVDDKTTYAVKTVNAPKDEQQSNEDYLEICNNELEVLYCISIYLFFICFMAIFHVMMKCV